uniref:Homogentisate 1,2-dioxygenase n=1 Tax=Panagrolaimus davidi TaxID=227884 RepID=A0A914QKL7_9BILA
MIPDFPMPPGLHGIFDSDNESCSRIYHSFENFTIPDDEFDDRGFNDPLPYSPIIKQVHQTLDLEFWISPNAPKPSSSQTPQCPGRPFIQISKYSSYFKKNKYLLE